MVLETQAIKVLLFTLSLMRELYEAFIIQFECLHICVHVCIFACHHRVHPSFGESTYVPASCCVPGLLHLCHHHLSLSIYLPFFCFFCWNFLKWVWMVAAAFSTSTGLSGGTGAVQVPLLVESEHDRTHGIAREVEAIAMETQSVAMIEFKHIVYILAWIQAGCFSD